MATSGSYDFNTTADNFINDALLHLGVLGTGETIASAKQTEALRVLNYLLKWLAGRNMPLWSRKRGVILPTTGQNYIANGTRTVAWDGWGTTTLSSAAAGSQADIVVTADVGFDDNDIVGVELDDGTIQWSIQSGAIATLTVTLDDNLNGAAAAGNRVYVYTPASVITTPMQIYHANILDNSNNARWPIELVSEKDFYSLGDLTSTGTPNQLMFDVQLNTGTFWWYPRWTTSSMDQVIEFSYRTTFQDIDTVGSDNLDVPQAFHLPVVLYLAHLLSANYGIDPNERKLLLAEATSYYEEALASVTQTTSIFFGPDYEGMNPYAGS